MGERIKQAIGGGGGDSSGTFAVPSICPYPWMLNTYRILQVDSFRRSPGIFRKGLQTSVY